MSDLDKVMLNIDFPNGPVHLQVSTVVRQVCEPDWQWDHVGQLGHTPSESALVWLVTGGEARLEADGAHHTLRRGAFLVAPFAGHIYHGRHAPDHPLEVTWLFFRAIDSGGMTIPMGGIEGIPFPVQLGDMEPAEYLMGRVLATRGLLQGTWLMGLFDEVRQQVQRYSESGIEQTLRHLGEQIQARPGRYHGLEGLAERLHCTKDHFIRLFRRYHGVTPGEFLIRARIDQARGVLAASDFSVKQVAAQLGYADGYTFSRQFKQRTGVSPRAYRAGLS